jgi:hypothetical protein
MEAACMQGLERTPVGIRRKDPIKANNYKIKTLTMAVTAAERCDHETYIVKVRKIKMAAQ